MTKNLTPHQQAIMDTLHTKENARIQGSNGRWQLFYHDSGFSPIQRITDATVQILFREGHITLGTCIDPKVTVWVPTTTPK